MEFDIDPQKVIAALAARIADLSKENATLSVIVSDLMEAASKAREVSA